MIYGTHIANRILIEAWLYILLFGPQAHQLNPFQPYTIKLSGQSLEVPNVIWEQSAWIFLIIFNNLPQERPALLFIAGHGFLKIKISNNTMKIALRIVSFVCIKN